MKATKEMILSEKQFDKFKDIIYDRVGIHLNSGKRERLQSKLRKLIKQYDFESYEELYSYLTSKAGKTIWIDFTSAITVNKTNFFRENEHFKYIRNKVNYILSSNKRIEKNKEIRVWSAGCSTGEEPYTLAIVLTEILPEDVQIKILATDISNKVLKKAVAGVYPATAKKDIPSHHVMKYFKRENGVIKANDYLRKTVTFRSFNLMSSFPFQNTFDIIFCRNVMIYFDANVQSKLIRKFYDVTTPGGLLFIGHSESLLDRNYKYRYIHPTIYKK